MHVPCVRPRSWVNDGVKTQGLFLTFGAFFSVLRGVFLLEVFLGCAGLQEGIENTSNPLLGDEDFHGGK